MTPVPEDELFAAVDAQNRFFRRRAIILDAVIVALAIVVAVGVWTLVGVLGRLEEIAEQNRANGDLLVECTTPSQDDDFHECFENGEVRTGRAVLAINCALAQDLRKVAVSITRAVGVDVSLPDLPAGCD
ncbi:MAG TPA: hypothetical protein VGB14_16250 [Acidimicrobiales bacterium]|jgi:hypothetical protein